MMKSPHDALSNQVLTQEELEFVRDFGDSCSFTEGEVLFEAGERGADFFFVVEGEIEIVEPWTEPPLTLTTHGAGEFAGDINIMMGRPTVAKAIALGAVEVIRVAVPGFRELIIRNTDIGDKLVGAFYRRRELTEEGEFQGVKVIGPTDDAATTELQEFFYRNGVGHTWIDSESDEGRKVCEELGQGGDCFPLVACASGGVHVKPSITDVAEDAGIQREIADELYDVLIIGSGPSGLGAAVYAASEGLRTILLDKTGPGGQAGSSSKIENYAGFPTGLSGRELALRAQLQAIKFGAEITAPCSAQDIRRDEDGIYHVRTCLNQDVRTKTVILSTGVEYRHLEVDGIQHFRSRGVYYSATRIEAALCQKRAVHIVGGGNSAGQAAMYLSKFASEVHLVIRGDDLSKSMSSYLSERVLTNQTIRIRKQSEIIAVHGEHELAEVTIRDRTQGTEVREESCGVFIFIGSTPHTEFLEGTIELDEKGFVKTGPQLEGWEEEQRGPGALETNFPGVFACGDVRSGTTKRVAFAIGDGALAVTCVHDFLGTYG